MHGSALLQSALAKLNVLLVASNFITAVLLTALFLFLTGKATCFFIIVGYFLFL
jgi:hypothetical protein